MVDAHAMGKLIAVNAGATGRGVLGITVDASAMRSTLATFKMKRVNAAGTTWRADNAVSTERALAVLAAGSIISAEHQCHPTPQK